MAKLIGPLVRAITDRVAARRQSTERWFMDREGYLHFNRDSLRRKPLTFVELEAIDEAVRDFANQSREVH